MTTTPNTTWGDIEAPPSAVTAPDAYVGDAEGRSALITSAAGFREGVRVGRYPVIPSEVAAALGAREQLQKARLRLAESMPPGRDGPALVQAIVEGALSTGGGSVDDAVTTALDTFEDLERRRGAARLLHQASEAVEPFLRDTIRDALPEILGGLRAELEVVVDTLRQAYRDAGDFDALNADSMLAAAAPVSQRAALATIAEQSKAYHRIRTAQRDALAASSLTVPGYDPWHPAQTWKDVFATGVHLVSDPGAEGIPGAGLKRRQALRVVVERSDVWLPDPDDLAAAYSRVQSVARSGLSPLEPASEVAEAESDEVTAR